MKSVYYKMGKDGKDYKAYLNALCNKKEDFSITSTTYTRRIKREYFNVIFNTEGTSDFHTLKLINRVKSDAKNYMIIFPEISGDYVRYFELFRAPMRQEILCKVDIKSAYWEYALKRQIITPDTDRYFKDNFRETPYKISKQARLRSLGALATTRVAVNYIKGVKDWNSEKRVTEPTKELYIDICRGVDQLMQECQKNIPGCLYYYWDCMFVTQDHAKEAVDFFQARDYKSSIEKTRMELVSVAGLDYLVSDCDGSMYMTRPEHKELLKSHIPEY